MPTTKMTSIWNDHSNHQAYSQSSILSDILYSTASSALNVTMTTSTDDVTNTSNAITTPFEGTVHDIKYNFVVRRVVLFVQIIFGILGAILVFVWVVYNRHLRSRVNALILNLCIADLLVILLGLLPQLVWEYMEREWLAGDIMCRLIKFLQGFSMVSSGNMLVVIALDRHQAIRAPLREPVAVWIMTGIGWGVSVLTALPMFFVFHTRYDPIDKFVKCENTFRDKPTSHRQAFLTYAGIINFLIPLIILVVCYIRIFMKIAQKASENRLSKRQNFKPGKIHLTSTGNSSLQKAKIKTLKMTVIIVAAFILCGLPYFVAEMIMSYGDFTSLSTDVYGILGGVAVANSAANPFVFLLFNTNWPCLRGLSLCPTQSESTKRSFMYSTASTRSEFSVGYSRQHPVVATETYEMSNVRPNYIVKMR